MRDSRLLTGVLLLGLIATSTGCRTLAKPNWCNPGTLPQQMSSAQRFDPFPDPNMGPDMGARPPGFERPRTETDPERRPPRG